MPARITLKVAQGTLADSDYELEGRTSCIIGRSEECHPRLPDDRDHQTISRHHCLLDVNAPDIRIRDFGSLNGTYVNGRKIGQREKGQTPEEAAQGHFPEHDLKNGDEIRLGKTTFRVGVYVPAACNECAAEIPDAHRSAALVLPGVHLCEACRKVSKARKQPPRARPRVCAQCGQDVSDEMGEERHGEFVCISCRAEPLEILRHLLRQANTGRKDLLAIQGYTVERELGRGGMGAVYLARHEKSGRQVALKIMLPEVAASKKARQRFLREIALTKALRHRNVVRLLDSGCSDGTFFFTLEYCDAGSVAELMAKGRGTLSVVAASRIILQVLDGLNYAHNVELRDLSDSEDKVKGLVHRDLKPPNILLAGTGEAQVAKIADYGLSKAFDSAGLSGLTRTGAVAGTPFFMPRQQVVNFKYAKPAVDVWAAAACLYFMLTGAPPREFPPGKDPWNAVLATEPVPIRRRNRRIPHRLADVIDLALRDNPELYFKTAEELKQALNQVL